MLETAAITDSIVNMISSRIQNNPAHEVIHRELPLSMLWPMLESIRVIELIVAIETNYDIILPDELLGHGGKWTTIGDLANEVARLAHERQRS
jgi:acyl carrier protein